MCGCIRDCVRQKCEALEKACHSDLLREQAGDSVSVVFIPSASHQVQTAYKWYIRSSDIFGLAFPQLEKLLLVCYCEYA